MEAGALARVVPLAEETGVPVLCPQVVRGPLARGQTGGMATAAQLLTGLAGLLVAGALLRHGPAGLAAVLPLLPLQSTRPLATALHIPPLLLATKLRRPRTLVPLLRQPGRTALTASPMLVARPRLLSWAS